MKKIGVKEPRSFDFDYWKNLAKDDPELFETKRREAVDGMINAAPTRSQQRLRGLQWRVDMERRKAKSPIDSCTRVYSMMWDSVYAKGGMLEALGDLLHSNGAATSSLNKKKSKSGAVVVSLRANS